MTHEKKEKRMETIEEQLFSSCSNGNVKKLKQLLINNSKVNLNCANNEGKTPFYVACQEGRTKIVKILLNDKRVKVNKVDQYGQTPLEIACRFGHIEIVKLLLNDKRVKVNKADRDGWTPFHSACGSGEIEIIKLLLNDERIDVNTVDYKERTPFSGACWDDEIEVVKVLLNNERVEINKADSDDWTAFTRACHMAHIEIVKLLLNDQRIDVNKTWKFFGNTPFMIACQNDDTEVIKLLGTHKRVDINKADKKGIAPLYYICEYGNLEVVEYILAIGRDVNLTSRDGKCMLDILNNIKPVRQADLESEEYFQQRKQSCRNIVKLLKSFKSDPIETRLKLRIKLGFAGKYFILYLNLFFIFYLPTIILQIN